MDSFDKEIDIRESRYHRPFTQGSRNVMRILIIAECLGYDVKYWVDYTDTCSESSSVQISAAQIGDSISLNCPVDFKNLRYVGMGWRISNRHLSVRYSFSEIVEFLRDL